MAATMVHTGNYTEVTTLYQTDTSVNIWPYCRSKVLRLNIMLCSRRLTGTGSISRHFFQILYTIYPRMRFRRFKPRPNWLVFLPYTNSRAFAIDLWNYHNINYRYDYNFYLSKPAGAERVKRVFLLMRTII